MKSLAFATYWLMVFAVISGISAHQSSAPTGSIEGSKNAAYSFDDLDCHAARHNGELAGVASVQCID